MYAALAVRSSQVADTDVPVAKDLLRKLRVAQDSEEAGARRPFRGDEETLIEKAMETELNEHLGHEGHDPEGRNGSVPATSTTSTRACTPIVAAWP